MNTLLALFISFLNFFPVNSDTLTTQSEINKVTIYKQQAQVQRTANLQLLPGKNLVVFQKLSPSFLENSVQLRGDKSFTILSLTKRNNYLITGNEAPSIERLNTKRDSLQKKINYLNSDLSVLEREIGLLGNTVNMINNQEMNALELTELLDLYRSRMSKLEHEKLSLNERIEYHRTDLNRILAQLRELGSSQRKQFSEVIAEIHSEEDQSINIELDYLVYNAGWNPSYDIRGTDIASPLALTYRANIYQSTGIDWNDITVTISSANPSLNSTLPQLRPSFIGFRTTPSAIGRNKNVNNSPAMYADEISLELDAALEMPPVPTESIQNQTNFSYKIEMPYSVPSDGKEHAVEFKREEIPADFIYATVPKLSNKAYLIGKVTDWDELNLLSGEASIYFQNDYIGSTSINPLTFDDSLDVSLGVDESIAVERKKLREFEKRNFFGNKVHENHVWEINLRNSKDETVEISVKDQVPLSRDESIEIDIKEISNGSLNNDTGVVTWLLKLAPGQTKTLRLDYQIEYPKGKKLTF